MKRKTLTLKIKRAVIQAHRTGERAGDIARRLGLREIDVLREIEKANRRQGLII